jgi:hypothetical protein
MNDGQLRKNQTLAALISLASTYSADALIEPKVVFTSIKCRGCPTLLMAAP